MKQKLNLLLLGLIVIILSGCSSTNNVKEALTNNNYSEKLYDSNFSTYTRDEITFVLYDKRKKATISYEDNDDITVTVSTDNNDIFNAYNCSYNVKSDKFSGNCSQQTKSSIKKAHKKIEEELKSLNLFYSDFNK